LCGPLNGKESFFSPPMRRDLSFRNLGWTLQFPLPPTSIMGEALSSPPIRRASSRFCHFSATRRPRPFVRRELGQLFSRLSFLPPAEDYPIDIKDVISVSELSTLFFLWMSLRNFFLSESLYCRPLTQLLPACQAGEQGKPFFFRPPRISRTFMKRPFLDPTQSEWPSKHFSFFLLRLFCNPRSLFAGIISAFLRVPII